MVEDVRDLGFGKGNVLYGRVVRRVDELACCNVARHVRDGGIHCDLRLQDESCGLQMRGREGSIRRL